MKKLNPNYIAWGIVLVVVIGIAVLFAKTLKSATAANSTEGDNSTGAFTVTGDTISVADSAFAPAGIQLATVAASDVPKTLTLTAKSGLNLDTTTHVSALFGGKVTDISVGLGQIVSGPEDPKGPTKLCVIESNDLAQDKANWLQALIQAKIDEQALARAKDLFGANVLAEKFLVDAESQLMKDQAIQEAARQQLLIFGLKDSEIDGIRKQAAVEASSVKNGSDGAPAKHEQTTEQIRRERMGYILTAPRSGVIAEKSVSGGEIAGPSVNLFTIADTSKMWVWGDVYERDLDQIKVGDKAKIIFTSDPDHRRETTIDWISPVLDPNSHSIRIHGTLDNKDGKLLADMYGTMLVTVDAGLSSIVVPSDAAVRVGADSFVFVQIGSAGGKTQFRRTPVSVESMGVGFGTTEAAAAGTPVPIDSSGAPAVLVRITKGLSPGQTIVKSGGLGLFDEMTQHAN